MSSLEIVNLHANINGTEILKGLNLNIPRGEVHAIMGPNGSGKSTLAKVMAGHEDYAVTGGDVLLNGQSLLENDQVTDVNVLVKKVKKMIEKTEAQAVNNAGYNLKNCKDPQKFTQIFECCICYNIIYDL